MLDHIAASGHADLAPAAQRLLDDDPRFADTQDVVGPTVPKKQRI